MDFLRRIRSNNHAQYQRLPTTTIDANSANSRPDLESLKSTSFNRRIRRHIGITAFATLVLLILARSTVYQWTELPDYAEIKLYESQLPQHNLDLPFPEGRDG